MIANHNYDPDRDPDCDPDPDPDPYPDPDPDPIRTWQILVELLPLILYPKLQLQIRVGVI